MGNMAQTIVSIMSGTNMLQYATFILKIYSLKKVNCVQICGRKVKMKGFFENQLQFKIPFGKNNLDGNASLGILSDKSKKNLVVKMFEKYLIVKMFEKYLVVTMCLKFVYLFDQSEQAKAALMLNPISDTTTT